MPPNPELVNTPTSELPMEVGIPPVLRGLYESQEAVVPPVYVGCKKHKMADINIYIKKQFIFA